MINIPSGKINRLKLILKFYFLIFDILIFDIFLFFKIEKFTYKIHPNIFTNIYNQIESK